MSTVVGILDGEGRMWVDGKLVDATPDPLSEEYLAAAVETGRREDFERTARKWLTNGSPDIVKSSADLLLEVASLAYLRASGELARIREDATASAYDEGLREGRKLGKRDMGAASRAHEAAHILIEEIGSAGPESIVETAKRAATVIRESQSREWRFDDPREHVDKCATIAVCVDQRVFGADVHTDETWWIDFHPNHLERRTLLADEPWPDGWRWVRVPSTSWAGR